MTIIDLCRLESIGKISRRPRNIDKTTFVAIYHIWGDDPPWVTIPIFSAPIRASAQKAKWLAEELPRHFSAGDYFWMDILAVDQSSKEARLSIVKHIPAIYKKARYTLIVREEGGFGDCRVDLFSAYFRFDKHEKYLSYYEQVYFKIEREHLQEAHPSGLRERWAERVWPLQELHLSDTVMFTICKALNQSEVSALDSVTSRSIATNPVLEVSESAVCKVITDLAQAWSLRVPPTPDGRQGFVDLVVPFVIAFLGHKMITRRPEGTPSTWLPNPFHVLVASEWDRRRTTKPREFILAQYPQFPWYTVPEREQLQEMTFSQIWADCIGQIPRATSTNPPWPSNSVWPQPPWVKKDHENATNYLLIRPKLVKGVLHGLNVSASDGLDPVDDVPVPESFGDFVRLSHICRRRDMVVPQYPGATWVISSISRNDSAEMILQAVGYTLFYSDHRIRSIWLERWIPNLRKSHNVDAPSSASYLLLANEFLSLLALWQHLVYEIQVRIPDFLEKGQPPPEVTWEKHVWKEWREHDCPEFRDTVILLAASIACGFSPNNLGWLRDHLAPHIVQRVEGTRKSDPILILGSKTLESNKLTGIRAWEDGWLPYITATVSDDQSMRKVVALGQMVSEPQETCALEFKAGCPVMVSPFESVARNEAFPGYGGMFARTY